MKLNTKKVVIGLITPVVLIGMLAFNPALAREPYTKAELADQHKQLIDVVNHGYDLWHGSLASTSTNGLACGNCHPDGSATNPSTFPKFQADLGRVAPLRDMINWCIEVPLQGNKLDVDGTDMVAMEAYATYMNSGSKIELGVDKQMPNDVVKDGRGYPWKGSGIGYDKGKGL
jgi:thiosulfate dehydrogenase